MVQSGLSACCCDDDDDDDVMWTFFLFVRITMSRRLRSSKNRFPKQELRASC